MPRFIPPLLIAAALALLLGGLSADYAVRHFGGFDTFRIGRWTAYDRAPPDRPADIYSRARLRRSGAISLGRAEGISFYLDRDDQGLPLFGSCLYVLTGEVEQARFFTLYAVNAEKIPQARAAIGGLPDKLFSQDIIRDESGAFNIILSPQAQAGNWLSVPKGRYGLALNLYNTPIAAMTGLTSPIMPNLTRLKGGSCG